MGRDASDIQGLLAAAGLGEDELSDLIDGSPETGRGAELLRRLGASPDLSALVWSMRADRDALSEVPLPEADSALVARAVSAGLSGEIPASLASEIEESGTSGEPPRMPRSRVVRPRGSRRIGSRGIGTGWVAAGLAACLGLGFLALVRSVWPGPGARPSAGVRIAGGDTETSRPGADTDVWDTPASTPVPEAMVPVEGPFAGGEPMARSSDGPVAAAGTWSEGPGVILTAGEALEAARSGRLIIRVIGASGSAARSLVESITTEPSVARVAVLAGESDRATLAVYASALPEESGPVYASTSDSPGRERGERLRPRAESAYTIEVEPTERAFALLLSGLRREPTVLVELVRTAEPVTTPGSVSDFGWFRRSPRHWQPRIAAPVVVETLEE